MRCGHDEVDTFPRRRLYYEYDGNLQDFRIRFELPPSLVFNLEARMKLRTIRLAYLVLILSVASAMAQTIPATEAKNHMGEQATVCGKVASEHTATSSRGEPTFINLDSSYPNQIFTILVWGDDRKNIGELPRMGSRVCASGVIKDFRGVPEIVVRTSGQLTK